MGKALLVNLSILLSLVALVYFHRNTSENTSFLEIPNKILKAANPERLLQTDSTDACANVNQTDYNSSISFNGQINAPLFGSYRTTNYLQADIMSKSGGNEDYKSYGISFIPLVVPWAVLWVLGIFFNCCLNCNQCCMIGCCKNCCTNCCRCCKKPKEDRKICRLVSGFFAMLCALGVIGAAAGGLIVSQRITNNYRQTRCAFYQAVDAIEYGNSSAGWFGIQKTSTLMTQLDQIFNTTFSNSAPYDTSTYTSNLANAGTTYTTALTSSYTTSQTSAYKTSSANPANSGTTVYPDIIANLGPVATTTTWYGQIDNERATKQATATSAGTSFGTNYNDITSSISTFQSNIDSGLKYINGLNSLFVDIENSTYSYTQTGDDVVDSYVRKALIGIFAGGIGIAVITLICPLCVCLFQRKFCNALIFLAWESFSSLMLVGFVIGVISLIVGIVITQGCDVMYQSLSQQGYLTNVTAFVSSSSGYTKYIDTCLFGTGNLVDQIGVTNTFSTLNNIEVSINEAKPLFQSNNGGDSTVIPVLDDALTKTIAGKYLVIASPSNQDGTAFNLAAFNSISDYNTQGSTQISTYGCNDVLQDQWVIDTTNCTYSVVWGISDTANQDIGSKICIGVDSAIDTTNTATGRYQSSTFSSCSSNPASELDNYRSALKTQWASAKTGLGNIKTSIESGGGIYIAYDNWRTNLYDLTNQIQTISGEIDEVLTLVSDPTSGLIYNLNCSFFNHTMRTFNYAMCDGLITTFYQITLAMLIMSTFACVGSIFQFCFAKYMRTVLENKDSRDKASTRT